MTAFNLADHAIVRTVNIVNESGVPYGSTRLFNSVNDVVRISADGEADLFNSTVHLATGAATFPFVAYKSDFQFVPSDLLPESPVTCSVASHYDDDGYYVVGGTVNVYSADAPFAKLGLSDDAVIVYVMPK